MTDYSLFRFLWDRTDKSWKPNMAHLGRPWIGRPPAASAGTTRKRPKSGPWKRVPWTSPWTQQAKWRATTPTRRRWTKSRWTGTMGRLMWRIAPAPAPLSLIRVFAQCGSRSKQFLTACQHRPSWVNSRLVPSSPAPLALRVGKSRHTSVGVLMLTPSSSIRASTSATCVVWLSLATSPSATHLWSEQMLNTRPALPRKKSRPCWSTWSIIPTPLPSSAIAWSSVLWPRALQRHMCNPLPLRSARDVMVAAILENMAIWVPPWQPFCSTQRQGHHRMQEPLGSRWWNWCTFWGLWSLRMPHGEISCSNYSRIGLARNHLHHPQSSISTCLITNCHLVTSHPSSKSSTLPAWWIFSMGCFPWSTTRESQIANTALELRWTDVMPWIR